MNKDFCYVKSLTGENYDYTDKIKAPRELGVSPAGNKLSKNISAIISYTDVLLDGESEAQKYPLENSPLGNRYFIKTKSKCKLDSGEEVDRHLYIDNIPKSLKIAGLTLKGVKGIVPGIFSDLNNIVPSSLTDMSKDNTCMKVNLHVRKNNDQDSDRLGACSGNVTKKDLKNINPCAFPKKNGRYTNIITGKSKSSGDCNEREPFISANENLFKKKSVINFKNTNNKLENFYILGVSGLLLYLVYKITKKY